MTLFFVHFFIEDSAGDIVKETKEETREKRIHIVFLFIREAKYKATKK